MAGITLTMMLITYSIACDPTLATFQSKRFSRSLQTVGTMSVSSPIFQQWARSVVDCVRMCSSASGCRSSVYAGYGSSGSTCEGYQHTMIPTGIYQGMKIYNLNEDKPDILTNVAYKKPAYQISTYNGQEADRAVDGDTDYGFCTETLVHINSQPWWLVDLEAYYGILSVTISSAVSNNGLIDLLSTEKLEDFDIQVYTGFTFSVCYHHTGRMESSTTATFNCSSAPVTGRHVLVLNSPGKSLSLCEVQVTAMVLP